MARIPPADAVPDNKRLSRAVGHHPFTQGYDFPDRLVPETQGQRQSETLKIELGSPQCRSLPQMFAVRMPTKWLPVGTGMGYDFSSKGLPLPTNNAAFHPPYFSHPCDQVCVPKCGDVRHHARLLRLVTKRLLMVAGRSRVKVNQSSLVALMPLVTVTSEEKSSRSRFAFPPIYASTVASFRPSSAVSASVRSYLSIDQSVPKSTRSRISESMKWTVSPQPPEWARYFGEMAPNSR